MGRDLLNTKLNIGRLLIGDCLQHLTVSTSVNRLQIVSICSRSLAILADRDLEIPAGISFHPQDLETFSLALFKVRRLDMFMQDFCKALPVDNIEDEWPELVERLRPGFIEVANYLRPLVIARRHPFNLFGYPNSRH